MKYLLLSDSRSWINKDSVKVYTVIEENCGKYTIIIEGANKETKIELSPFNNMKEVIEFYTGICGFFDTAIEFKCLSEVPSIINGLNVMKELVD